MPASAAKGLPDRSGWAWYYGCMGTLFKAIIPIVAFLVAAALQLSGIVVPLLGYSLMGLAAILLLVAAWPWLRRIRLHLSVNLGLSDRPRQGEMTLRPGTDAEEFLDRNTWRRPSDDDIRAIQGFAGTFRTMMSDDLENTQRIYWVRQDEVDWTRWNVTVGSAYVEFVFRLTSASVWNIKLTTNHEGLLKYRLGNANEQGDIRQAPIVKISDQPGNLSRTFSGAFWVQQFLPTEVAGDLHRNAGNEVTFLFGDVKIAMELHSTRDGRLEHRLLSLPSEWKVSIPPIA